MFEAAYLGYVRNVQYLLKYGAKCYDKVDNMFGMDAIEACAFKNKVKILFLFLKLKVVTLEQFKTKAEILKRNKGIDILNAELIKNI